MVCTKLHEAATCFLHKQFVDIISGDEFLSLGKEEVLEIIGSDELNVPREEQVSIDNVEIFTLNAAIAHFCKHFPPDVHLCLQETHKP